MTFYLLHSKKNQLLWGNRYQPTHSWPCPKEYVNHSWVHYLTVRFHIPPPDSDQPLPWPDCNSNDLMREYSNLRSILRQGTVSLAMVFPVCSTFCFTFMNSNDLLDQEEDRLVWWCWLHSPNSVVKSLEVTTIYPSHVSIDTKISRRSNAYPDVREIKREEYVNSWEKKRG